MRLQAIVSLGCVLLLGALAACTTEVTGIKMSKDFVYADIIAGKMAIAGVASSFEELSDKDANRIATNLQISIQEERKDYPLTPMPEVRNTMGQENYVKMMTEYATDGLLSGETLQKVHQAIPERFLVLVRIENDATTDPRYVHVPDRKDSAGRLVEKQHISVEVRREIKVTAQVYDLSTSKSVWSGLVTSWGREEKKFPIQQMSDLQVLGALISGKSTRDDRTMAEKYPPPNPPPLYRMLPNAFETFAGELPKK